jgi:hypothetical protein
MSVRRIAARAGKSFVGGHVCECRRGRKHVRIKVLDSETRASTLDNNDVPRIATNLLSTHIAIPKPRATDEYLAGAGRQPAAVPYRCTIESKFSWCASLPRVRVSTPEERSTARRSTTWMTRGKARKQLYTLVAIGRGKTSPPATAVAVAAQPARSRPRRWQNSAAPAPAPVGRRAASTSGQKAEKVKCNFTSTPPARRSPSTANMWAALRRRST